MNDIEAVVVDPGRAERVVIRKVAWPQARGDQAIVRVKSISLNRGEVRRSQTAPAGFRPGWDFAGIVEQAAADGSGPKAGARVVGMLPSGAWAQVIAAGTNALAEVPEMVSLGQAATLPVAGLTALHSLYKGGFLVNQPVLVTGATGGTGDFACQLGRLGGANMVATVRSPGKEAFAWSLGVEHVVVGDDPSPAAEFGPYRLIIDSVGGANFGKVLGMLGAHGVCVIFGATAGAEPTINTQQFYSGGPKTLYGFLLFNELLSQPASNELKNLVGLVASGKLTPHISLEDSWRNVAAVAQKLTGREFLGKAVLHIDWGLGTKRGAAHRR
jgi:NADPH:quinone reductase